VKKECDKLLAEKKESGSSSATTGSGSLRHLTEEAFKDAVMDYSVIDSVDIASNDTSNDILAYFSRMSNHYLRLAKASPHLPRHPMKYPIIADSGANYHMIKEKDFFSSLQPTSGSVLLGDGKSVINIEGVGTVKFYLGSHLVTLSNVR
jgi:hypothetical protein